MRRALLAALLVSATPALASDEASWEAFRAEVRKGCEKAVAGTLEKPAIAVDPHGSESYGIAIAKGKSKYSKDTLAVVCVFDKRTKKLETSGEFAQ
ncbi:MAG: hypothetical protein CTY15_13620 [Methylocystis sp.]|nr:MAG: hypothetical protein CTY15_13620 [Methylocystis sp.]